jgi:hypothetical protein
LRSGRQAGVGGESRAKRRDDRWWLTLP